MTIAAGFVTRDGLLLCSDSQYTGWEKSYAAKLFARSFGFGTVSFAFAGSVDHARSIIEDCWETLETLPSMLSVADLRSNIRRVIKNGLQECPPKTDLPEFLIGVATRSQSHLFVSRRGAMPRAGRFEFLGSGSYIAQHVMKSLSPVACDGMGFEEATLVGLTVLAAAKRNDSACGGVSQFLASTFSTSLSWGAGQIDQSDAHLDSYEYLMRNLFLSVAERSEEKEFAKALGVFCEAITHLRNEMQQPGSMMGALLECIRQVGQEAHQQTTGGPSRPLPSQE